MPRNEMRNPEIEYRKILKVRLKDEGFSLNLSCTNLRSKPKSLSLH